MEDSRTQLSNSIHNFEFQTTSFPTVRLLKTGQNLQKMKITYSLTCQGAFEAATPENLNQAALTLRDATLRLFKSDSFCFSYTCLWAKVKKRFEGPKVMERHALRVFLFAWTCIGADGWLASGRNVPLWHKTLPSRCMTRDVSRGSSRRLLMPILCASKDDDKTPDDAFQGNPNGGRPDRPFMPFDKGASEFVPVVCLSQANFFPYKKTGMPLNCGGIAIVWLLHLPLCWLLAMKMFQSLLDRGIFHVFQRFPDLYTRRICNRRMNGCN
jgi:hypothetical protein